MVLCSAALVLCNKLLLSCLTAAGVQLVEPLAAAPGERTLIKKRFSAFFATELDLVLK